MKLSANNVHLGFGDGKPVIEGLDLAIDATKITAIIGANGCGKSTLLSALAGILHPRQGEVFVDDADIKTLPRRALAKRLAFLPQQPHAPEELTVRRIVSHGRFAHRGRFAGLSDADNAAIDEAMSITRTDKFADRAFHQLSGGEKQRVWLAMTLAQTPETLLLDEPTSYLDIGFQFELLDLLKHLNATKGLGIVMVLHDINQASWYADRIVAIRKGEIVADGPPADVVCADTIQKLFNFSVRTEMSAISARPTCFPAHL